MSSSFNFNGDVNFTGELYRGNSLYNGLTGKMLRVDSVFGNDIQAALNPFQYPFQTINAAISNASSGNTIFLYPGTYVESITVPTGVSIRGSSTQTTTIQQSGVTGSTTLVTLSPNTRIEDVTMTLTSHTDNIELIGIKIDNSTSTTSKVRTCVLNVTHTNTGSTRVYGLYATGTSNTSPNSSNLFRATTINTSTSGVGGSKGIFIGGSLRAVFRDTNIYSSGSTGAGGCETTNSGSILELRKCTVSGSSFDISQSTGSILLDSTDLVNSLANNKGFTVSVSPSELIFGIAGNMSPNTTYYLVPGILPIASLSTTTPFETPVIQNTLFFKLYVKFSGTISGGDSIVFTIYKNGVATELQVTLTSGQTSATLTSSSVLITPSDLYYARVQTIGNIPVGTFIAIVLIY